MIGPEELARQAEEASIPSMSPDELLQHMSSRLPTEQLKGLHQLLTTQPGRQSQETGPSQYIGPTIGPPQVPDSRVPKYSPNPAITQVGLGMTLQNLLANIVAPMMSHGAEIGNSIESAIPRSVRKPIGANYSNEATKGYEKDIEPYYKEKEQESNIARDANQRREDSRYRAQTGIELTRAPFDEFRNKVGNVTDYDIVGGPALAQVKEGWQGNLNSAYKTLFMFLAPEAPQTGPEKQLPNPNIYGAYKVAKTINRIWDEHAGEKIWKGSPLGPTISSLSKVPLPEKPYVQENAIPDTNIHEVYSEIIKALSRIHTKGQ